MLRTDSVAPAFLPGSFTLPSFARWNPLLDQDDSSVAAGAALANLYAFWVVPPPYHGVLAERMALKAAAATLRSSGRPEDEDAVRDQWWLRQTGEALSPAARTYQAWLMLVKLRHGWSGLTPEVFQRVAELFDRRLIHPAEETMCSIEKARVGNPFRASAEAARTCFLIEQNEALAHFVADAVLAAELGWERPLPLLAAHIASPSLRAGGSRRRLVPSDAGWGSSVRAAYALSAVTILALARHLDEAMAKLIRISPKLRARAAKGVIEALLAHACLSAASPIAGMSDRGMRRLFERLVAAGGVRELTGRSTFRLYGL